MKILVTPRGGGKTTDLIDWAMRDPIKRVVITHSRKEADRLLALMRERLLTDLPENLVLEFLPRVITADERTRLLGLHPETIAAIDNLDLVLAELFHLPVVQAAVTGSWSTGRPSTESRRGR